MNREQIRQLLAGHGKFIIRTSDGREYAVPHPEFVFVGRHNLVVENAKGIMDIIDPLHVASIRPVGKRKSQAAQP